MMKTAGKMMAEKELYSVTEENVGARLDVFVSAAAGVTRSAAQRLIEAGDVTVGGAARPKNYLLRAGDEVFVSVPEPEACEAEPEDIPLDVVYEDGDIIVVNKPRGMVVHPAAGNEHGTLVNALLFHCGGSLSGIGGVYRPGIVHRIDKDTTGLIAAAKNDAAHEALSRQLASHEMHRIYRALAVGTLRDDKGTVDAPIGRHPTDRKRMAVVAGGREARTDYTVVSRMTSRERESFSYIECRLHTGRTHQIRVHMAYLGHPLAGDAVYGGGKTKFEWLHCTSGQLLHAYKLLLRHPRTGKEMEFEAPLPADFASALGMLAGE